MSGYHDASWRLSEPPPPSPPEKPREPATFRESFRTLSEPYRSTFLRVGAAMLDLDDPAVFENACRLADSATDVP